MATQIQLRRDTAANWTSENPILADGEHGIETDANPKRFKIGDGTTLWNDLDYFESGSGGGAVDSVNGETGTVVLDADDLDDTTTANKFTTEAEATKLSNIEDGATVGADWDVNVTNRPTTISAQQAADIETNNSKRSYPSADETKLSGIEDNATLGADWDTNVANRPTTITAQQSADITANNDKRTYPSADETKLGGIEEGAQVNAVTSVNGETGDVIVSDLALTANEEITKGTGDTWASVLATIDALPANWGGYAVNVTLADGSHPLGNTIFAINGKYNGELNIKAATAPSTDTSVRNSIISLDGSGYFDFTKSSIIINGSYVGAAFSANNSTLFCHVSGNSKLNTNGFGWDTTNANANITCVLADNCDVSSYKDLFEGNGAITSEFVNVLNTNNTTVAGTIKVTNPNINTTAFSVAVAGRGAIIPIGADSAFGSLVSGDAVNLLSGGVAEVPGITAYSLSSIVSDGATVNATSNRDGAITYGVYADGSPVPTDSELTTGSGTGFQTGSSLACVANTPVSEAFSGLSAETIYDIYLVNYNSYGDKLGEKKYLELTTAAIPAIPLTSPTAGTPVVNSASSVTVPISGIDVNADSVAAYYKLNSSGTWIEAATGLVTSITEYEFTGLTEDLTDFSYIAEGSGAYSDSPRSNVVSTTPTSVGYGDNFVLQFTTTAPNEEVSIEAFDSGVYNALVDWENDGNTQTVTTYNDSNLTHTFATAGTHIVQISGTSFPRFYFNNSANAAKVTGILNVGDVGLENRQSNAFYGCNIPSLPTDAGAITFFSTGLRYGDRMFRGNSGLGIPNGYTLEGLYDGSYMFYGNGSINIASSVTLDILDNGSNMFQNCTIATTDYSQLLINIEANNIKTNRTFHGGNSQYEGASAIAAKEALYARSTPWSITDGGLVGYTVSAPTGLLITGTEQEGQTLTLTQTWTDTYASNGIEYRWYNDLNEFQAISYDATYVPDVNDVGRQLECRETPKTIHGSGTEITSPSTGTIIAA